MIPNRWAALVANRTTDNVRTVIEGGKTWLVAPAAIIPHGVMSGSKGPLYYPAHESERTYKQWDRVPITVQHPFDPVTGSPLAANDDGVKERQEVGETRNPTYDGKTRVEAWFDEEKVRNKSPETWQALKRDEKIPLSTGLYTDNVPKSGSFNGVPYIAEALNHRPDHLAVLPGGRGACHLTDGCGVNVTNAATVKPVKAAAADSAEARDRVTEYAATVKNCGCGGTYNSAGVCNMCGAKATGEHAQNAGWEDSSFPPKDLTPAEYQAIADRERKLAEKCLAADDHVGYKTHTALADAATKYAGGEVLENDAAALCKKALETGIAKDHQAAADACRTEAGQAVKAGNGPRYELLSRAAAEHESAASIPTTKNMWQKLWELVSNAPAHSPADGRFVAAKTIAGHHAKKGFEKAHEQAKEAPERPSSPENPNKPEEPEPVDALGIPIKGKPPTKNREWSQKDRDNLPPWSFAGPDQSYPIETQADLDNAVQALGRAKDQATVKAGIKRIAARRKLTLPDAWTTDNIWTDEAREASKAARAASAKAKASGKKEDHIAAGNAHAAVSEIAFHQNGKYDDRGASKHDEQADAHFKAAGVPNPHIQYGLSKNSGEPMTKDQALAKLTANCKCEADKAVLANMSPELLIQLASNKEFESDDERKAAFAHMNSGSSGAAHAASAKAEDEGTSKAHKDAAKAHKAAAKDAKTDKSKQMHEAAASHHLSTARGLSLLGNELLQLNAEGGKRKHKNKDEEDDDMDEEEDSEFDDDEDDSTTNKLNPKNLIAVVNHLGKISQLVAGISDPVKREKMTQNLLTKSPKYIDQQLELISELTGNQFRPVPQQSHLLPIYGAYAPPVAEEPVDNSAPVEQPHEERLDYTANASPDLVARLKQGA